MKLYSIDDLRKEVDTFPKDTTVPSDIAKKYNLIHSQDPVTGVENPSGRAWVMWFLDKVDEKL